MEPQWIGCPESNFRKGRPFGLRPEAIVVHIMDGSFAAGESVFRNPETQKSAHYGISRDGEVHQYVNESDTAFHAGIVVNPSWPLLKPIWKAASPIVRSICAKPSPKSAAPPTS